MGVFIISPNDKGGQLWKPSQVLVDACRAQDITPIALNNLWLWQHAESDTPVHTLVVGAARPSDFDEVRYTYLLMIIISVSTMDMCSGV
jgi:uncharacterized protein